MRTPLSSTPSLPRPQKRSRLANIYLAGFAAITLGVAFLEIGNYLTSVTGGVILPKHVYFTLVLLTVPGWLLIPKEALNWTCGPFATWALAFVALNFIHWIALTNSGQQEAASITLTRIQYLVLAVVLAGFVVNGPRRTIGLIFVGLCTVLTVMQLTDFLSPGLITDIHTEGLVLGRAGSTLINPNKAAESLIIMGIFGMTALKREHRIWLLLLVLPGVVVTFSRAGIITWAAAVLISSALGVLPRAAVIWTVAGLAAAYASADSIIELILSRVDDAAAENVASRLRFFQSFEASDFSAQERAFVADQAISAFYSHPIFGSGAGATHVWDVARASAHNQHYLILAEYGLIGYVLFLALLGALYRSFADVLTRRSDRVFAVVFFVVLAFTPFTHNMFDSLYWLLSFALLAHRRTEIQ